MKLLTTFLASLMALATMAQGTAAAPEVLTDGTHTIAIDETAFRQILYYSYTSADEDRLLSIELPTANAQVIADFSGGNPFQSEFPTFCFGNDNEQITGFACYAPKGKTVYLKVTLQVLAFPPGTTSAEIKVSSTPCEANNGQDMSKPFVCSDGSTVFLPLEVGTESPFLPVATYVSYTVEHDGFLYLNFTPSITSIYYRHPADDSFTILKAEYVLDNGKTVGSKAILEVKKGEQLLFEIKGFNGTMLTTTLENPEPGTSCDFPLALEGPGLVAVPDEPGDYYWSFTPTNEGNVELTSDMPLENGYIEVMMDCNFTGSFTINNILWLRTWIYDRMEYLIHLKKESSTKDAQFNLTLTEALPCDKRYTADNLQDGREYKTPDFAGTYYYRINADDKTRDIKLNTLASDLDSRTRVNFYDEEFPGETLARGLDMKYTMQPGVSYILQWTVFDNKVAIPFNVSIIPQQSGIETAHSQTPELKLSGNILTITANNHIAEVYTTEGKNIWRSKVAGNATVSLAPGIYIVRVGEEIDRIIVK